MAADQASQTYQNREWLYEHYVKKRMNLSDIAARLKKGYGIEVTPQAIYNWCKKYDLLKYRGKGRSISRGGKKRPKSPAQIELERRRREMKKINDMRKKGRR